MSAQTIDTFEKENKILYPVDKVEKACREILTSINVSDDVTEEVTRCLIETSLRGVETHGVNLLPHYVEAVLAGRIKANPDFRFKQTSPTTGVLDADDSFGHAAASLAMKKAIVMSRQSGSGFVSVCNSSHFSACSYYSLQAARENMVGFATTHTDSIMVSTRSKKPFLGTNPISFTFPCEGEEPVCLDMATTQVTWNSVKLAKQAGEKIEPGLAVNENGEEVQDAQEAAALLPFGRHKGYALAFVVEVFCSLISNMPYGPHVTSMYKAPLSQKRELGHFVGTIDIERFIAIDTFKRRMKELVTELRNQEPIDPSEPVLVPGDPEKKAQAFYSKNGIPIAGHIVLKINDIIVKNDLARTLML